MPCARWCFVIETDYEKLTKITLYWLGRKGASKDPDFPRVVDSVLKEFFKSEILGIVAEYPEYSQTKEIAESVGRRPYLPIPFKPEQIANKNNHLGTGGEMVLKFAMKVMMEQVEL